VIEWFRLNIEPPKKGKSRKWGVKWHARLVFQYERPNTINSVAKRLAADESLSQLELRELLDEDDDIIVPGEEAFLPSQFDDDESGPPPTSATEASRKVFAKYQAATTLLWNELTEEERERYIADADVYRAQGVPKETCRK
jgi:hypothetical protein